MHYEHVPVMLGEVLEYLAIRAGQDYLDGTLGGGGYARAIAVRALPGRVLATDADPMAIKHNQELIEKQKIKNLTLINANFQELSRIVKNQKAPGLSLGGLVLDLGLSGAQLEDQSRGFSFKLLSSPLDMAFGSANASQTTSQLVNESSVAELSKIIRDYGEEAFAPAISRGIVAARSAKPLVTVGDLLDAIKTALPARLINKPGIHWATKTFQALRIATNDELSVLRQVLAESLDYLPRGARIVVVSYHSLEDRVVKEFFRQLAKDCLCPPKSPICTCHNKAKIKIITKKALGPTAEEVAANPRSRSAKLRAAEII
jgi:16S rRNA (cytosine1402-N4)-methyltransferase